MSSFRGPRRLVAASGVILALLAFPAPARADNGTPTTGTYAPKGAPPTTAGKSTAKVAAALTASGNYYSYNDGLQDVVGTGVWANVYIAQPTVDAQDAHSLGEIAVIKKSNDLRQMIEVGWTVDNFVWGDGLPHLFVYHWVNGVATCYNGCGWVAADSATVKVGDVLPALTAKKFEIHYNADDANGPNWGVYYDGALIGWFPATLWTGASPAVTDFTSTDQVQVFGEVASATEKPCTDMGTGTPGSKAALPAAYFGSATLINGASATSLTSLVQPATASPDYYSMYMAPSNRTFFYGGPGYC
ncbi:neprosin family prolyl endopeptidase [Actinoplanes subtropicus]|uniref:neprosin family prolyl endopeptidase n=1 Tax=Actinoplanes subtropicus TaxID=543632 RepID=UPI00068B404E|nr:neprosin family prolyl endopeptidase [Actinoplanes subtropicus]